MFEPFFQGESTVRTEIRVGYDDDFIYVSGRMFDDGPSTRLVTSLQRDGLGNDDLIMIELDTFNDNENGVMFATNPAGVRWDASVANDAQGFFGGGVSNSWNTFWDAAVTQTEEGWFAEMRIPFSSLRFQNSGDRVEMGLKVFRQYAQESETLSYPLTRTEWNQGLFRPSRYQDVVMRGVKNKKPVYVTPYALGGVDRTPELNPTATQYNGVNDGNFEAGIDLKYGLTSNLTLDLTANTDFAQVEADNQQVNLTRFSLFFPEKRQFFLERGGIFNFSLNDFARVFHSRRIGIGQRGESVRILGGARVVGRAGPWDVGVINMQTAGDATTGRPSFNNGVYRLRRRVFNEVSSIGAIATTKIGEDGTYNMVWGADAIVRLTGDTYMEITAAQSSDGGFVDCSDGQRSTTGSCAPGSTIVSQPDFDFANSSRVRFTINRRSSQGLGYGTWITRSGINFNPELGFIQRSNFTRGELMVNYGHFSGSESSLRFVQPMLFGTIFWRNDDKTIESGQVWNNYSFGFKSGASGGLAIRYDFDDLRRGFSLSSDAGVPAGRHKWATVGLNVNSPQGNRVTYFANGLVGGFYDGTQVSLGGGPAWTVSPHLQLSGNYTYNRVEFDNRAELFTSHLARVRVQGAINSSLTGSAFLQYSSAADIVSANFRIRYHFSEGRDLFIVLNESLDTDRQPLTPLLPREPLAQRQTLIVKYSYTFVN